MRPETGLTANGPLAPGLMHAGPPNFGVGGCGFGVTGVAQRGGQRGPGGHVRARARAGSCQGALAAMYVDGRGVVGTDASPLHPP